MTGKRKLLVIITAAVLLLAAGLVFLWTNLDGIVRNAIERYGSQATGTEVRVDSVSLEPVKGKGAIKGLTVANPRGYSAPHIISLGGISVRIDPRAIALTPAVIDDIRIAAPQVFYEMNDARVANIDVLKKNLAAGQPARTGDKGKKGFEKRLRIRRLVIENARAEIRIAALGGKPRTVALSRIEMTDIGGKDGAPPEEVARQIVSAILTEVSTEAGKAGAEKLLEKGLERLLRRK
jgi:hypothetical protein